VISDPITAAVFGLRLIGVVCLLILFFDTLTRK